MPGLTVSSRPAAPLSETSPSPDEMVARAASMRELLRAEQQATEERSFYSEEIHDRFKQLGLYRIMQPKMFGGYEMSVETFYRVVMEIARGCPSTGWCFCLGSAHVLQLASHFGEQAQREAFGDSGEFIAAARDLPAGTVRPVAGGYEVSGTWNYCSGAPYSTHFIGVAKLVDAQGNPDPDGERRLVMIPRADWTLMDDWRGLLGMRGSGSHSIKVDKAIIPEHFVVAGDVLETVDTEAGTPGFHLHGNALYNGRNLGFFHGEFAAILSGIAHAAIDEYDTIIRLTRTVPPLSPGFKAEAADYQRPLGIALGQAAAAREAALGGSRLLAQVSERGSNGGEPFSLEEDLLIEGLQAQSARLSYEVVEMLVRMSGSSNAVRNGRRMERYLRDASVYRSHAQGSFVEIMATELAKVHLAGPGPN
ncbi:acyl-CoA dehydrogenase family protein [Devosia sp. YIM 151766]|uniref:acyl-CoA dehydrogenase family protein n=1 Tax=Devosia sp. YIM 151766 TaxID=3017325 RepID=UPI00255C29FF|nr:acyl-CoA dehydrogenase family protein [Devosia sp. YIM 151766]WIY52977.1 acyl-CoA dehydrogenase family protein [Devosia sp. YIM 151766]